MIKFCPAAARHGAAMRRAAGPNLVRLVPRTVPARTR